MSRIKSGRKYRVLPGGRLEPGEDFVSALHRELLEETGVFVRNPQLVFIETPVDPRWGPQHIYLCEYVSGVPALDPSSDEFADNKKGINIYTPEWIDLPGFRNGTEYPFLSRILYDEILAALDTGFPEEPKRWTFK